MALKLRGRGNKAIKWTFLEQATSKLHRIHLTVVESELEEALFTECDDYVSIRDREGQWKWSEVSRGEIGEGKWSESEGRDEWSGKASGNSDQRKGGWGEGVISELQHLTLCPLGNETNSKEVARWCGQGGKREKTTILRDWGKHSKESEFWFLIKINEKSWIWKGTNHCV